MKNKEGYIGYYEIFEEMEVLVVIGVLLCVVPRLGAKSNISIVRGPFDMYPNPPALEPNEYKPQGRKGRKNHDRIYISLPPTDSVYWTPFAASSSPAPRI